MHRERRAIRRNGSYAPGSSVSVISECENATPKVTSDAVDGRSTLAVQALDMGGVHGAGEPDYTWDVASNQHDSSCAGLAAWDVKGTIVSMEPIVTRDGPEYRTLMAGLYNGVLKVEGGDTPNYSITYISGNRCALQWAS